MPGTRAPVASIQITSFMRLRGMNLAIFATAVPWGSSNRPPYPCGSKVTKAFVSSVDLPTPDCPTTHVCGLMLIERIPAAGRPTEP